ncbi:MAG: DUF6249 domain-containing protein [Janthinobacterium lividum]
MSPALLGVLASILVPLAFFALIFGIIYLRNRERMAMIERDINPSTPLPPKRKEINVTSLQFGLLLMGSGLGLFIAYLMDFFVFKNQGIVDSPAIYFSLIAFFGGLGLFISYLIERKASQKKDL